MSTKKLLNLRPGDVILVDNCIIAVVRHKGYVKDLSNGKYDHFVGIEIQHKMNNTEIGIATNGEYSGHIYFSTTQDKGRFIREHKVTKKFLPEELYNAISNPSSLILNSTANDSPLPKKIKKKPIKKPEPKPTVTKPLKQRKPATTSNPITSSYDEHGDIGILAKRLDTFCNVRELKYLIEFCKSEEFTDIGDIQDDLDVFEGGDSAIIDTMKKKFTWDAIRVTKFVHLALNTPTIKNNITVTAGAFEEKKQEFQVMKNNKPSKPNTQNNNRNNNSILFDDKKEKEKQITTQWKLPLVSDFTVPISIMRKKDERSINDIVMCLKKNKISSEPINKFKQFCNTEKYKFQDLETNLREIRNKFRGTHNDLIVFMDYIEKCIYELSPPVFKARKFSKKDEDNKHAYFEKQCKGVIKHDRDLLQYFCITENTERELPSELIDIADRIAVEEKQDLNIQQFGKRYFFKHCDKMQINKVKQGLRKYHNRFLPLFPKNPLKQVADKISGYQKYCILLSHIITSLEQQICSGYNKYNANNELLIPYMIDMMIIPPGCFNKVDDANTKQYDSSGPEAIGDIKKRLSDFSIPINETRGLTDKNKNFDVAIMERISKKIIEYVRKITNGFTKKNQRIVILVDRRWRINCDKFDAYNKLRGYKSPSIGGGGDNEGEGLSPQSQSQSQSHGHKKNKSNSWTKGWFGGGSGGYEENKKNRDFYNKKCDTIYIYQPNLSKIKKSSYHEFQHDYCHETLIYLTKQCIIPRKDHYMHIGGDTTDGWLFNISAHIQIPNNRLWYKYDQRWYIFLQSAALRFFPSDMDSLWKKYFVDADEDSDKLSIQQIKQMFRINLEETDSSYKRWYYAIKRSD